MSASPLGRLNRGDGSGQIILIDGLARGLSALGHQVTVFVRRDDVSQPGHVSASAKLSIEYLAAGPPTPVAQDLLVAWVDEFSTELRAAWRRDPPDAIHAFGLLSAKAAISAAQGEGFPVVQTLGQLPLGDRRRDVRDEQRSIVRRAARVIATSSAQVFALLGLGASPGAIKFVPCGVDLELFSPAPGERGNAVQRLRIATLSGLAPAEGIDDVIEALALVDGIDLVIGGGPVETEASANSDVLRLRALAQARGLGDRVHFQGCVGRADVAAFLRRADIVVCTPHTDSIGTLALEAMACGVPLIVSSVGGLVDTVADGLTGLHVPPRAPRQLAYALETLRGDSSLRDRFGRFGVERTRARYGWPRIAAETLDIYRNVMARNPGLTRSHA